jgi:hypothetical protein
VLVRSSPVTAALPAIFGSIRGVTVGPIVGPTPTVLSMVGAIVGATVGLMVGSRAPTLMFGERTMFCACTADPSKQTNGKAAAVNIDAARLILIRQLERLWTMGPRFTRGRAA